MGVGHCYNDVISGFVHGNSCSFFMMLILVTTKLFSNIPAAAINDQRHSEEIAPRKDQRGEEDSVIQF
jgi:hypothetical protein